MAGEHVFLVVVHVCLECLEELVAVYNRKDRFSRLSWVWLVRGWVLFYYVLSILRGLKRTLSRWSQADICRSLAVFTGLSFAQSPTPSLTVW